MPAHFARRLRHGILAAAVAALVLPAAAIAHGHHGGWHGGGWHDRGDWHGGDGWHGDDDHDGWGWGPRWGFGITVPVPIYPPPIYPPPVYAAPPYPYSGYPPAYGYAPYPGYAPHYVPGYRNWAGAWVPGHWE